MAIRRLLFPEATVSQTSSYCLTAGLWCKAETLSLPPPPPLFLLPLPFASLLCWFSGLLFLSENLYKATARKRREKEIERGKEARREAEWSGRGNSSSSVILLKLWSMLPARVGKARCRQTGGLHWFAPYFTKKKWVLNPTFSSVSASPWIKTRMPNVKLKHI